MLIRVLCHLTKQFVFTLYEFFGAVSLVFWYSAHLAQNLQKFLYNPVRIILRAIKTPYAEECFSVERVDVISSDSCKT